MIRSRSFALVDTESKVSACTHMPIVRYEDARFSKRDDSVIQEAELTVFVNGARQCDMTCSPWDVRELVAGNLFLAGVITDPEQVSAIDVDLDSGAVSVRVDVAGASRRRRRHVETLRDGGVVISGVFERLRWSSAWLFWRTARCCFGARAACTARFWSTSAGWLHGSRISGATVLWTSWSAGAS